KGRAAVPNSRSAAPTIPPRRPKSRRRRPRPRARGTPSWRKATVCKSARRKRPTPKTPAEIPLSIRSGEGAPAPVPTPNPYRLRAPLGRPALRNLTLGPSPRVEREGVSEPGALVGCAVRTGIDVEGAHSAPYRP